LLKNLVCVSNLLAAKRLKTVSHIENGFFIGFQ
jgi:hypothetical protein